MEDVSRAPRRTLSAILYNKGRPADLSLSSDDVVVIDADARMILPRCDVPVTMRKADGTSKTMKAVAAIETRAEVGLLRAGGVLPLILKQLISRPEYKV